VLEETQHRETSMSELQRHNIWRSACGRTGMHRGAVSARRRLRDHPEDGAPQTGVIVVGVDDSPASRAAVEFAAIEAGLRMWDLWLLHVHPAGPARYSAGAEGARLLERMADQVHESAPTVTVSSHLAVGAAATVLLAELTDTDMVVVGQHSGPAGTAFGLRIEERVAALHPGPALVVPVPGRHPAPGSTDRPVVVGVDDSSSPAPALDFARAEARLRGCELIVLHATADSAVLQDRREHAEGIRVHHRVVAGDPAAALVAASERAAAAVVGRHGAVVSTTAVVNTTFVDRVGRALVRDAACPVFLIG
jgi:hypothetical protein